MYDQSKKRQYQSTVFTIMHGFFRHTFFEAKHIVPQVTSNACPSGKVTNKRLYQWVYEYGDLLI